MLGLCLQNEPQFSIFLVRNSVVDAVHLCGRPQYLKDELKRLVTVSPTGAEFVHHNSLHLTRVYPNGFRTDSSNFNPQEMWNAGCQVGEPGGRW